MPALVKPQDHLPSYTYDHSPPHLPHPIVNIFYTLGLYEKVTSGILLALSIRFGSARLIDINLEFKCICINRNITNTNRCHVN